MANKIEGAGARTSRPQRSQAAANGHQPLLQARFNTTTGTNTPPLQAQNRLNIYGKRGWQHDDVGKIGDQVRKSPLGPSPQKSRQTNPNKQQPNLCH